MTCDGMFLSKPSLPKSDSIPHSGLELKSEDLEFKSHPCYLWAVKRRPGTSSLLLNQSINECHKQIPEGQRHPIETKDILCDECYAVRKKELGRLRTQKCREKKKCNIE